MWTFLWFRLLQPSSPTFDLFAQCRILERFDEHALSMLIAQYLDGALHPVHVSAPVDGWLRYSTGSSDRAPSNCQLGDLTTPQACQKLVSKNARTPRVNHEARREIKPRNASYPFSMTPCRAARTSRPRI